MKNDQIRLIFFLAIAALLSSAIKAQSGGNYAVTQTVVAPGGKSDGGNYSASITVGQPAAGRVSNAAGYAVIGGFWQAAALNPTAASVSVGGRVLTSDGRGVRNVLMTLTEADGATRTIMTGAFGYYRFDDVSVGQTVAVSAFSKRFGFAQPVQVANVTEGIFNLDFATAQIGKNEQ